jgi:hypothetical protein
MNTTTFRRIIAGLILAATLVSTPAADLVWTNLAGGNWNNTNNWSPNTVPGATDSAFITNAGTYTVTINAAATVTNLTLGATGGTQTLINTAFTLTLNGNSFVGTNGVFTIDAGASLTGAGNLNVAGILNWTGGAMTGTGRTVITNGATLNIAGFSYGKSLVRHLDLYGTGTVSAPSVVAGGGIFFNVWGGATLDFTADYGIGYSGSGGFHRQCRHDAQQLRRRPQPERPTHLRRRRPLLRQLRRHQQRRGQLRRWLPHHDQWCQFHQFRRRLLPL